MSDCSCRTPPPPPSTTTTRLLCPWDSPGKNTGVGCHFLPQGIFPVQGSNLGLPCRQTNSLPLSLLGSSVQQPCDPLLSARGVQACQCSVSPARLFTQSLLFLFLSCSLDLPAFSWRSPLCRSHLSSGQPVGPCWPPTMVSLLTSIPPLGLTQCFVPEYLAVQFIWQFITWYLLQLANH